MCTPTDFATAPTLSNDEQSIFAHTLNVRLSPTTGGALGTAYCVACAERFVPAGNGYRRVRPDSRRKRSKATANGPCGLGVPLPNEGLFPNVRAIAIAVAAAPPDTRVNGV